MSKSKRSRLGKDIVEELLSQESSSGDNDSQLDRSIEVKLNDKFVLQQLQEQAKKGNVRALELLGRHFKIFDKDSEKGNELIDIFAEEGTIEENIIKFLDIMEDKYAEELAHSVPYLQNQQDIYLDEKEKKLRERQLQETHERNLQRDQQEETSQHVNNLKAPGRNNNQPRPLTSEESKEVREVVHNNEIFVGLKTRS